MPELARSRVVVFGTGTMAAGIAAGFMEKGLPVTLVGRNAEKAQDCISKSLALVGRADEGGAPHVASDRVEDIDWSEVVWVIETIVENMHVKQQLFERLDSLVPSHIPIGSNSSGFPISKLVNRLKTSSRFMGAHYFMPAEVVPLVEIVLGEKTDVEQANRVVALYREIGKKPVLVKKDIPGFLANRIQHALMREALNLVELGVASPEDVDDAVRYSFGFRYAAVGPMTQKEISGWDGMAAAAREIYPSLSNATKLSPTLERMMVEGRTGMKAGHGFRPWTAEEAQETRAAYMQRLSAAFKILNMP